MGLKHYYNMGRIAQLKYEGRELLGRYLSVQVKRDGQNVRIYVVDGEVTIGSHRLDLAEGNISERVKRCPEWTKVQKLALEFPDHIFFYECLLEGHSPTRIEKAKKYPHMILLDIWDDVSKFYYDYTWVHQQAYQWRIPIVRELELIVCKSVADLLTKRDECLKWCKRHYREGVCIKTQEGINKDPIWCKEKLDLPKCKSIKRIGNPDIDLPTMPNEKVHTAIERALNECVEHGEDPKDAKYAMPRIALHLNTEAREHFMRVPENFFACYQGYLEDL